MLSVHTDLPAGFSNAVVAAQATFRAVMEAMARPGSLHRVGAEVGVPHGLMPATAALSLTLFDHDTPIWIDDQLGGIAPWIRFHTGAPITADPADAGFALASDAAALPELERFALGTPEYPDRSTTIILQVPSLVVGRSYQLRGPGIDGVATLCIADSAGDLIDRLTINAVLFPRGIDLVLVHDDTIIAIPRTTRLAAIGG
jgi:alpha-D-ribose 1-methylphosphonate 5-triphosphate synthase subunit PhnH